MKKLAFLVALILFITSAGIAQSLDTYMKSRLGFVVGPGFGFSKIPIAELTNGDVTSITFGGGTVVKFEFGHQFSKHFDLSIHAGGQFSRLDKFVSNGNMSFNRSDLSVTPSYVLPLGAEGSTQLKIGLGLDYLYNAELNFDLSAIPGGANDDWHYNSTIGEHISTILEFNSGNKFSFSMGLKLHTEKFSFDSGTNSYPLDSQLDKPQGSGMDLLFGAYYHFKKKGS